MCVNQASDTRAADVSNASEWTNRIGALAQIHAVSIYQRLEEIMPNQIIVPQPPYKKQGHCKLNLL